MLNILFKECENEDFVNWKYQQKSRRMQNLSSLLGTEKCPACTKRCTGKP